MKRTERPASTERSNVHRILRLHIVAHKDVAIVADWALEEVLQEASDESCCEYETNFNRFPIGSTSFAVSELFDSERVLYDEDNGLAPVVVRWQRFGLNQLV